MLRFGVVDRDHGKLQGAVGRHGVESDDPGGRFFGAGQDAVDQFAAALMQGRYQVAAVVHGQVRLGVERRIDMLVIGLVILAVDRIDRDTVMLHQGGGVVVLSRERVGRA
jgi:hypothetical protein